MELKLTEYEMKRLFKIDSNSVTNARYPSHKHFPLLLESIINFYTRMTDLEDEIILGKTVFDDTNQEKKS